MELNELIKKAFPELVGSKSFIDGTITLQDDSDNTGAYIREWNYSQPIPDDLKQYLRA